MPHDSRVRFSVLRHMVFMYSLSSPVPTEGVGAHRGTATRALCCIGSLFSIRGLGLRSRGVGCLGRVVFMRCYDMSCGCCRLRLQFPTRVWKTVAVTKG